MRVEDFAKRLRALSGRYGVYDLFRDWVAAMACAISNAIDRRPEVWAQREAEYMAIVKRYGEDAQKVMNAFAELQAGLVVALTGEPDDVLGRVYMTMELGNKDAGQFFTPPCICEAIAELVAADAVLDDRESLPPCGYLTLHEPAIGGGAMVIAFARSMQRKGWDPSRHVYVTGVDVDRKVLQMAYVQLSLLGIPAVLYVGNSLTMEMREDWFTPIYVVGGWRMRLDMTRALDRARAALAEVIEEVDTVAEPQPAEPAPVAALPPAAPDEAPVVERAAPKKAQLTLF